MVVEGDDVQNSDLLGPSERPRYGVAKIQIIYSFEGVMAEKGGEGGSAVVARNHN